MNTQKEEPEAKREGRRICCSLLHKVPSLGEGINFVAKAFKKGQGFFLSLLSEKNESFVSAMNAEGLI